jgi:hypothetical protein
LTNVLTAPLFLDEHHGRYEGREKRKEARMIATLEAPAVPTSAKAAIPATPEPRSTYELLLGGARMHVAMNPHEAAELEKLVFAVRIEVGDKLNVALQPVSVRSHADAGKWLLDVISGKWS